MNSAIQTLTLSRQSSVPASPQTKLEKVGEGVSPQASHQDLAPTSPVNSPSPSIS